MTTASKSSGAAGQYCKPATTAQVAAATADSLYEDECPLTLLLFSSLHTDGLLFDEAEPAFGALQPG